MQKSCFGEMPLEDKGGGSRSRPWEPSDWDARLTSVERETNGRRLQRNNFKQLHSSKKASARLTGVLMPGLSVWGGPHPAKPPSCSTLAELSHWLWASWESVNCDPKARSFGGHLSSTPPWPAPPKRTHQSFCNIVIIFWGKCVAITTPIRLKA